MCKSNWKIIEVIQVGTKTHIFDLNNIEFIDTPEDDGHMCFTEDEFLNEAIREIRLFEKEERK